MTRNLLRAGALSCALLTSTCLTAPAMAQTIPPTFRTLDENGVDLVRGDFVMNFEEGAIGSGRARLSLVRQGFGSAASQYDGIRLKRTRSGNIFTFEIGLPGGTSDRFTGAPGPGLSFSSSLGNGATLTDVGYTYVYRAADGRTITFADPTAAAESGLPDNGFCAYDTQTDCDMLPESMTAPDGSFVSFFFFGALGGPYRLWTVTNSYGYSIHFNYGSDGKRSGADFFNEAVSTTTPQSSVSYTYPTSTTVDVETMAGDVWRLTGVTATGTAIAAIRRPGAASDTTTIARSAGKVSAIARDGVTTNYAFSASGSTGTAVVTLVDGDPGTSDPQTTIVSNLTVGRPTQVTDALGRDTSYQYDTLGRLTRVTADEGNYVQRTYDSRGNVTQTQAVAKPGSGAATITTSASFPSSCANPVTCNLPTSTTDARGNVTDYSYDSTHGGVLTVTGPAPASGADRPQVRYSYTQSSGEYVLTGVSACASGTAPACVGTANESRTVIAYDGQGNVTSTTRRDGTGALSAVEAMTYDARGNLLTVDGPLAGAADTTRLRYDGGNRLIGMVSADPDGAGTGQPHRAVRVTFTDGLPTEQEIGTVASQSDADWAGMTVAQETRTEYDSNARPVVQRLLSGSTTYSLAQASYDSLGRVRCTAQRMNPAEFAPTSLPADACTLDTQGTGANDFGPDRIVRTSYDALGRPTLVEVAVGTSAEADAVRATYTANGQVETLEDGENNLTTYVYDGHDRLSRTRFPSTAQGAGTSSLTDYEQLTYDAAGNVTNVRLRDNTNIAFTYDALGRVTLKNLINSTLDVVYAYDLHGRMTSASRAGQTLTFSHDALGPPAQRDRPARHDELGL